MQRRWTIPAIASGSRRLIAAAAVVALGFPGPAIARASAQTAARPATATATAYVPAQFLAKLYTEGLGRIPDQAGWQSAVTYFRRNGCSAASLATYGQAVYTSSEYTRLGYDNVAKLLTLYRGALNREPDPTGFGSWLRNLASGTTWQQAVHAFFTSSELAALVPRICSGVVDGSGSSYYFGTQPALAVPVTGAGFSGTEATLQALLNGTPPGRTVTLARRALIWLTKPLVIPHGVTLTTAGTPDPHHYADMARLVRAPAYPVPTAATGMVQVQPVATLSHVWVDGARGTPRNQAPLMDVMTFGGGTMVSDNRIGESWGPSNLYLLGEFDGHPCPAETVARNLITDYASDHHLPGGWADGISDNCGGASITANQIVDATDVGIVAYRNTATTNQHSVISGNYLLSAGNSMYGGLGFDPLYNPSGPSAQTLSFAGATVKDNILWTGPNTHFDIALVDGSREWYARPGAAHPANIGTGASIIGNTTGTQSMRVQTGIAIAGMLGTTVSANNLTMSHVAPGTCPKVAFAAEVSLGYASGTFGSPPADVNMDGCIG